MIRYISTLLIVLFPLISYGLTYPGSYLLKDSFYLNVTGNYESGHSVINTDNISLTFMVTGNAYSEDRQSDGLNLVKAAGLISHFGIETVKNAHFQSVPENEPEKSNNPRQRFSKYIINRPFHVFMRHFPTNNRIDATTIPSYNNLYNSNTEIIYELKAADYKINTNGDLNTTTRFPNAALDIFIPITNTTRSKFENERSFFSIPCQGVLETPSSIANNQIPIRDDCDNIGSGGDCNIKGINGLYGVDAVNNTNTCKNTIHFQNVLVGNNLSRQVLRGWGVPIITFHESNNLWAPGALPLNLTDPTKPKFTIAAKFVHTGHRQRDETLTHGTDKNLRHDNGEYTGGFGAYTLQHAGFYNLGSVNEFNPDGQLRNDDLSFASTELNNAYLGFFHHGTNLETNSPSLVLRDKSIFSTNAFMEAPYTNVGIGVHYNDIRNTPRNESLNITAGESVYRHSNDDNVPIQFMLANFAGLMCKQGLMNTMYLGNSVSRSQNEASSTELNLTNAVGGLGQNIYDREGNATGGLNIGAENQRSYFEYFNNTVGMRNIPLKGNYPQHLWRMAAVGWFDTKGGHANDIPRRMDFSRGCFRNGSLMPSLEMPISVVNTEKADWWWQNNTDIDAGNNIDRVVFNYTPGYNNEPDNSNLIANNRGWYDDEGGDGNVYVLNGERTLENNFSPVLGFNRDNINPSGLLFLKNTNHNALDTFGLGVFSADENHVDKARGGLYPEEEYFRNNLQGMSLADHLPWATLEVWGEVRSNGLIGSTELEELKLFNNTKYAAHKLDRQRPDTGVYALDEIEVIDNIVRGPIFANFVATPYGGGTNLDKNKVAPHHHMTPELNMFGAMLLRTADWSWISDIPDSQTGDNACKKFEYNSATAPHSTTKSGYFIHGNILSADTPNPFTTIFRYQDDFACMDGNAENMNTFATFNVNELVYDAKAEPHPQVGNINFSNRNNKRERGDYAVPMGRIETGPYNFPFIEFYYEPHRNEVSRNAGYGFINIETGFLPDDGNVNQAITKYHLRYRVDNAEHEEITSSNKSFIIDHPDDKDKYLVHYMLEGPDAEVYYRGKVNLVKGRAEIALPDYFEALTLKEKRNVQLTNLSTFDAVTVKLQNGERIKDGKLIVISQNPDSNAVVSWEVTAVRADVPQGNIEPKKSELKVNRDGPYTWGIPQ